MKRVNVCKLILGVAALLISGTLFAGYLALPSVRTSKLRADFIQIELALRLYADKHSGAFPNALSDLAVDKILPNTDRLSYSDPYTRIRSHLLYYSPVTAFSDTQIVVAISTVFRTPFFQDHCRMVIYANGEVDLISERAYQDFVLSHQHL